MREKAIAIITAIALLILQLTEPVCGQTGGNATLIDISHHDSSLRQILDDITDKSGLLFVYNSSQIDDQLRLDIKVRQKSLENVMTQLSNMLGFEYIILDKQIILKTRKVEHQTSVNEKAKTATISGYILDHDTREPLIGASVSVEGTPIGTTTNEIGYYSITLNKGRYTLVYGYLGYQREYVPIIHNADYQINQTLHSTDLQLEAITITSHENQLSARELINKSSTINIEDFKKYSGLVLGGDLVGILSTDHGITRISDGSAFYSVRGGFKDQNMVLIDDAPIYHPSHLFGFYSSVAPQSINSIEVYTADFPIKNGGRLSSITDIKTKDGSLGKLGASVEFTPLTTSLRLESPIISDKVTATGHLRKSTLGWGAKYLKRDGDFSFYDIHGKVHIKLSDKDRLYLSIFSGSDYYSNLETGNNYAVSWKNIAATIRNYRVLGPRFQMNQILYFGQYKYKVYTNEDHSNFWNTRIGNISLRNDFTYNLTPKNTLKFGAEYSYHIFTPATLYINKEKSNSGLLTGNADNITIYMAGESSITQKIAVKYGTRINAWSNYGPAKSFYFNDTLLKWDTTTYAKGRFHTYMELEPRVSVLVKPTNRINIKASAERNVQFHHMLSNSISPFTTLDLWIPSGNFFKPQEAYSYTISGNIRLREILLSTCLFHKKYHNLTEYKLHANMLMNRTIENEFYLGEAVSNGIELSAEKNTGKLRAKAFYTYTRSTRHTPDLYSYNYIPDNSIPHVIHTMVQYSITPRLIIKADWNYNTGIPYTKPVGFYYYDEYKIPYYGERNNARLPCYHKLNIALEYTFRRPGSRLAHDIMLSVYNLYNRNNYVMVSYNKIKTPSGTYEIPSNYIKENHFVATGMTLPGLFPMISYQISYQHRP